MNQAGEATTGETVLTVEKTPILPLIPSSLSLYQESSKIVNTPSPIPFDEIVDRLGISFATSSINKVRMMYPEIQSQDNQTKVRIARAAALHELLYGKPNAQNPLAEKAIDIITSDHALQKDVKTIVKLAEQDSTQEAAREQDISYVRRHAGIILERKVLDGKIPLADAIAVSSLFDSGEIAFSSIEKAQIINFYMQSGTSISENISGIDLKQLRLVLGEIGLRKKVLQNIISSLPKDKNSNNIPLSGFTKIVSSAIKEFRNCQTTDGLKKFISEIIKRQSIPEQISGLTEIINIIKNHPEIRAVSFDLYDTLIQWTSNQAERRDRMDEISTHLLRKKYGLTIDKERVNRASSSAWKKRWEEHQAHGNEIAIDQTISLIINNIISDPNITRGKNLRSSRKEMVEDLEKLWYRVELETAAPMPGALDTLRRLKALGIKIGITSNASWSETHMKRVLNRFGLSQHIDSVSYSAEQGKMKHPDVSTFFHYAWRKLGVNPSQVLHIGDSRSADYEGTRNAGGTAVLYKNPDAFSEIEKNRFYWDPKNHREYIKRAREYHQKSQNEQAVFQIEDFMEKNKVPVSEKDRVRLMAMEVYQKSRDVIGPAYVTFADRLLRNLQKGRSDINLCLARDGLPFSLIQKMLLHLDPERYDDVRPEQIKYAHISRRFLDKLDSDQEFKARYLRYLSELGIDKTKKIMLVDLFCGSGKTHEGIKKLLGGKKIDGYYIDSFRTDIPGNHSFLRESTGNSSNYLRSENMLLVFETLFSGPYESASDIMVKSGRSAREMTKKKLPAEILVRGLSGQSILLLNHVALRGLMDAAEIFHRDRLLGISDSPAKNVMEKFYLFIKSHPSKVWIDIWRSVPWQDYGKWYIPSNNPAEKGWQSGKIN